ncbi:hypothetical protein [Roseovarius sp. A46]|uniref:hypothetical protein n=1 Tax=Roseovarius sp. A46 TaxID=2109331 RepID=UPI001012C3A4|nr:hypothetical protein [Roseovarius sp. A46]
MERAKRKGLPQEGKQRSARHVTKARIVVVDLDGVPGEDFKRYLRRLGDGGIAFLAYSSHSHGDPRKRGVRSRIVVPVDVPLASDEYRRAASGLQALYFGGQADQTGLRLSQQQGVWATSPAWRDRAFRIATTGRVLCGAELIAACPAPKHRHGNRLGKSMVNPFAAACEPVVFDVQRVSAALKWIDPIPYTTWVDTALYLKGAYGDESFGSWLKWTNSAPDSVTAGNTDDYAPEVVWEHLDPVLPPEAGAGALFAAARAEADAVTRQAIEAGSWLARQQEAVGYLIAHHNKFFHANYGGLLHV